MHYSDHVSFRFCLSWFYTPPFLSLTHFFSLSLSLSLSLKHTHTVVHTTFSFSLSHTHHTHTSHTHTHTMCLSLSLKYTHSLSLSYTHTLSHTYTIFVIFISEKKSKNLHFLLSLQRFCTLLHIIKFLFSFFNDENWTRL